MDMDITKIVLSDKPGRGSLPWASAASAASISARRGGTSSLGVGGGWGAGLGGPRTLLPWPGTKRWKWIGWGLPSTSTKKGGGIRCGSVCVWNKVYDNLTKSLLKVCCKWSYRHPASFFFCFNFGDPKRGVLEKGGDYSHNCYKLNKTIMLCVKKYCYWKMA